VFFFPRTIVLPAWTENARCFQGVAREELVDCFLHMAKGISVETVITGVFFSVTVPMPFGLPCGINLEEVGWLD
jgi:hypothetical protein